MGRVGYFGLVIAIALVGALDIRLAAHDAHLVGRYRLEIGWGEEPALAGSRNYVVVEVTDAAGHGAPPDLAGSTLAAELTFGAERVVLPLRLSGQQRNEFRAWVIPTRPGTYTLHITGNLKGQAIDVTSTCSDKTFDCVVDTSDMEFPTKDPSRGELAERIGRTLPRAEQAMAAAAGARTMAFTALALSGVALAAAFGLGVRKGRKGT